eukprot:5899703-Prorocentrum_lima.AAC.1
MAPYWSTFQKAPITSVFLVREQILVLAHSDSLLLGNAFTDLAHSLLVRRVDNGYPMEEGP